MKLELPYCIGSPPNHYVDHASLAFSLLYVNLGQCPRLPPLLDFDSFQAVEQDSSKVEIGDVLDLKHRLKQGERWTVEECIGMVDSC